MLEIFIELKSFKSSSKSCVSESETEPQPGLSRGDAFISGEYGISVANDFRDVGVNVPVGKFLSPSSSLNKSPSKKASFEVG